MKRFLLIPVLFTLCNVLIFAQTNHKYLIAIDLSLVNDLNIVEQQNLPVIHMFDNILISETDSEKLLNLTEVISDILVIDESNEQTTYYLVNPVKARVQSSDLSGYNSIYNYGKAAIIKEPHNIDNLIAGGYSVTGLYAGNVFYKNEKTINIHSIEAVDTSIANVVANVHPDSVAFFIQSLQDFQTRFLFATTRDSVASWIKSQFIRFGFTDVKLDSFLYQNTWQTNVVATLTGSVAPEKVFVFGGHHDSYSSGNPYVFAPGADDNASGTAAVLEIARAIMVSGYQPKATIKFITFAAEEYGLWGSKHYAAYALNQGMDIRLMINHDMISHTYSSVSQSTVDINRYSGSEAYASLARDMVFLYSVLTPFYGSNNSGGSDSYPFWQRGYNAVYFEERDFSPYYHSPQDIITNYSMPYCAEVIKSSGALLLTADKKPSEVKNYFLYDVGNGTSLSLSWLPNNEPDFIHYKIYIGLSSGTYYDTFISTDTTYALENLNEGTKYFVAVSTINSEGYESFLVERSMTPNSIPLTPKNFIVTPKPQFVELTWRKNSELDLEGYNIYRSESLSGSYIKLNSTVYTDTMYNDNTSIPGQFYHYFVTAIDNDQNESAGTDTIKSRIISLDQGILLVDETVDGNGTLLNPTDQQVDDHYNLLLSNFRKDDFDILAEGAVTLALLGAYSTVIWQGNDLTDFSSVISAHPVIKDYLDYGGKFLYDGYRPGLALQNNMQANAKYQSGMFIYDYFKIDSSSNVINSRFVGALPINQTLNPVFIDSSKTNPAFNFHLASIEAIFPNNEGNSIYLFETHFDTTTNQGRLRGRPVGVEYLGTDYKTVVLSFPLYYMNLDQAKALIEDILISKFDEVTGTGEDENVSPPREFALNQNYPNPFNPTTVISYQLPAAGKVTLKVYDILGNEIAALVNQEQPAGMYEVKFDASGLSSGVYFYRLSTGSFTETKKMMLLR